jgi:hypothetical protein
MRAKWFVIGGVGVLAILAIAVFTGRDTYASARIGTAYVAKQTCSCLFIANRSMDACMTDYNADDIKPLTLDVATSSVSVSALGGLVSAKAEFDNGYGCHPVD